MEYNSLQSTKGFDKRYEVFFMNIHDPLHLQLMNISTHHLHLISPAELGYLRTRKKQDNDFMKDFRTNMDVLMVPQTQETFLIKNGIFSSIYSKQLVDAHAKNLEFNIPIHDLGKVYGFVKYLQSDKEAILVDAGMTILSTALDDKVSNFIFSDEKLGIKSVDYGKTLQKLGRKSIILDLDDQKTIRRHNGPYLNMIRLTGYEQFQIDGETKTLNQANNAMGVSLLKLK